MQYDQDGAIVRVPTWGREDWGPRCRTLIMQPTHGFAVIDTSYDATIVYLAQQLDPSKSMIQMVAHNWRKPVHEVWQDVHSARKDAGHA